MNLKSISAIAAACTTLTGVAMQAQAQTVLATNDGIIRNSLCVGTDCSNTETFGFDTLRLKENNTQLHFDDTSNSASFPANDWRIIANDSTNGGASYLAVEDATAGRQIARFFAGAPSNGLVLDSDGDLGIKTATPVVDIHVVEGNTPTLRLEQDGSDGFTPYSWDVAGNEAGFFIRDVTSGSTLPFRILPGGAPSQSLVITGAGNVGMGAGTNPDGKLNTRGSGVQLIYFDSSDNNAVQIRMRTNSQNRRFLATNGSGAVQSQIIFEDNAIKLAGATDSGANLWATINASGITTRGPDCGTPCDGVFDRELFVVPPIEERAAMMWENQHLPAVGPTGPDLPFNVTEKTAGMLHELEIAHIYIERLNTELKDLRAEVGALKAQIDAQ